MTSQKRPTTITDLQRTKIPWSTAGVEKLAVETVVQIQIWDPNSQKELKGKIMGKYSEGVAVFSAALQTKFLIALNKKTDLVNDPKSCHQSAVGAPGVQE